MGDPWFWFILGGIIGEFQIVFQGKLKVKFPVEMDRKMMDTQEKCPVYNLIPTASRQIKIDPYANEQF